MLPEVGFQFYEHGNKLLITLDELPFETVSADENCDIEPFESRDCHIMLDLKLVFVGYLIFPFACFVGGGGLGDFAYRYGYQRYRSEILMVCVVILIVLVQLIQTAGDFLVKRISRR